MEKCGGVSKISKISLQKDPFLWIANKCGKAVHALIVVRQLFPC
jgi:hypothetical protein